LARRDLHLLARAKGRPWDPAQDIERGWACCGVVPMPDVPIERGDIALDLTGQTRQKSDTDRLSWNIREIAADLSLFHHLQADDLVCTGTPEGVGPVVAVDKITGRVKGVGDIALAIGPAA